MKTTKRFLLFILLFGVSFFSFSQDKIDLLMLNKNFDEALLQINKQIEENPSIQLYFKKGLVYNSLQKYQEALVAFSEALQLDPNNSEIMSEMAESLSILGNNADAIQFYKKALKLGPDNLPLAGKLGRVYINLKEYKNAYDIFSGIYLKDSSNVFWNKQLAYCSFRMFKREQAVFLYEKVLEANPRDYGTYSNLIHAYNWQKEGNKIMAAISKGLNEFPNDAELLLEQANYLFKTKRYGPAMENFKNYFEAGGDSIYEIAMNYGISTYFADFTEEALRIFNDLNRANPNDAIVLYYQSLCYKKLKNFEESEKLMQWAIDATTPDYVSEMYHHLGQILGQQRKFEESINALKKSNEMNPENVEVLFEIATTFEEYNSNKTMALNYYRIYLTEAGESGKNINYALERITKIKEDLFFQE